MTSESVANMCVCVCVCLPLVTEEAFRHYHDSCLYGESLTGQNLHLKQKKRMKWRYYKCPSKQCYVEFAIFVSNMEKKVYKNIQQFFKKHRR